MAKAAAKTPTQATDNTASDGKLKALGLAQEQINKQFGDGAIRRLGDTSTVNV